MSMLKKIFGLLNEGKQATPAKKEGIPAISEVFKIEEADAPKIASDFSNIDPGTPDDEDLAPDEDGYAIPAPGEFDMDAPDEEEPLGNFVPPAGGNDPLDVPPHVQGGPPAPAGGGQGGNRPAPPRPPWLPPHVPWPPPANLPPPPPDLPWPPPAHLGIPEPEGGWGERPNFGQDWQDRQGPGAADPFRGEGGEDDDPMMGFMDDPEK
jgi:hypothetical protein